MIKQKVFKGTNSNIVSATIDADGDLFFHNIPSVYILPIDGSYQVKDSDVIDIWEYEYISSGHSTKKWKTSKVDRKNNYGLDFFDTLIKFHVENQRNHYDLDGTKSITAIAEIVLENKKEAYALDLTVDIFLSDTKLDEHSLEFNVIEACINKHHKHVPTFEITNLTENVASDLGSSNAIIAKYIRARIFDSLHK